MSVPLLLVVGLLVRDAATSSVTVIAVYAFTIALAVGRSLLTLFGGRTWSSRARYWAMLLGGAAAGMALGALDLLMFRNLQPLQVAVWSILICGMGTAATVSLGPRPEIFIAYAAPALGGVSVAALLWPRDGFSILALVVVLALLFCTLQAVQTRNARRALLLLHLELDSKVKELAEKNDALEQMARKADRIFAALTEALPGKTIGGKYILEEQIGEGGFAVVFRALHVGVERAVAVKVFHPSEGNDSAEALARFRFEAFAGGMVRHPNIVDVIDAGMTDDGIAYIAMELLEGHSLEVELKQPVSVTRAADVMAQVARGLSSAHASGVIHRDIKPANIFLKREGAGDVVKILDFGIAKVTSRERSRAAELTQTGALMGTPMYMSPERLLGEEFDASADIYSCGVVLYRMLAGRLPFEGNLVEVMVAAASAPPPDLCVVAPHVPATLARVVMESLDPIPANRPSAARLAVLRRAFDSARVPGRAPA